jgi:hypothetical protein
VFRLNDGVIRIAILAANQISPAPADRHRLGNRGLLPAERHLNRQFRNDTGVLVLEDK